MKNNVKIINFKANKFGVFQAIELDFDKFKQGVIAIKGNAGAGKSTIQKGVRLSTQGRDTLADPEQYGDEWDIETQLSDGGRKIFIGATKKPGESISYKLYEKDDNGKKVMTPIIDGVKATPAKYMDTIATELTFGIKDFLSDNNTVHKKFMFKLFRSELEKLGVVFDKKDKKYEESILGQLDKLTEKRDSLRAMCIHKGAFMSDFERDGYSLDYLSGLDSKDLDSLEEKKTSLLIEQGKAEGDGNAAYEKAKSKALEEGRTIFDKIRELKESLMNSYKLELSEYEKKKSKIDAESEIIVSIAGKLKLSDSIGNEVANEIIQNIYDRLDVWKKGIETKEPKEPLCPSIIDGKIEPSTTPEKYPLFGDLLKKRSEAVKRYTSIQPDDFAGKEDFSAQITEIESLINNAKANNELVERFELNRDWVESDAKVTEKRKELQKLYTKIDTGVKGLYMMPFFDKDGKMDIKTVYTGVYDVDFFNNRDKEERLLVSYSSTQKPIIGVLLQVARLKKKSKVLPYVFFDDVPMDKASYALISKIAEENGLTIMTSITGDFSKEKLTENEMLVEGGDVFFN